MSAPYPSTFAVVLCLALGWPAPLRADDDPSAAFGRRLTRFLESMRAEGPDRALVSAAALVADAERTFGPESLELARALAVQSQAIGHMRLVGQVAVAPEAGVAAAARSLAIVEKVRDPAHEDVAEAVWTLAVAHDVVGEHAESARLMERALSLQEAIFGPDHSDVAWSMVELSNAYLRIARYAEALDLARRAETTWTATDGADSRRVASALQAQALATQRLGDVAGAEQLLRRALAIRERLIDDKAGPFIVSQTLQYLGVALAERADYAQARSVLERCLDLRERRLGPQNHHTGLALLELAEVLRQQGELPAARAAVERALAIHEAANGPGHPAVASDLHRLAEVTADLGRPVDALPLAARALAVRAGRLGEDHPSTAETRLLVARLTADDSAALAQLDRAVESVSLSLGRFHPLTSRAWRARASRQLAAGDRAGAIASALRAEDGAREWLQLALRSLDERGALAAAAGAARGLPIALAALGPDSDADSVVRVLDAVVRSRALVLDEMGARHRAARAAGDPEVARLENALAARRERLARLALREPGDAAAPYRALVEEARRDKEAAEGALAQRSLAFREERDLEARGLAEVRSALGPRDALVAYVQYRPEPGAADAYAAFVVREQAVSFVPLGAAAPVDAAIARWRGAVVADRHRPAVGDSEASLRRAIWDAPAARLAGASRVFLVPDGALHLVSFAALPTDRRRYLLETGPRLHYLSAERDLVPAAADVRGRGLLAFGDPDFEGGAHPVRMASASTAFRSATPSCGPFADLRFARLRASGPEVAGLPFDPEHALRLRGADATEAAVKERAAGHRVLHLATHAFFVGEGCRAERGAGDLQPLLRTGLALAGANRRATAPPDGEDGILTAEEIASLDLRGLEWAVLSACGTGVGAVTAGEGVLGLARAFRTAGAGTTVMSLWPVDDEATRRFMQALYRARFVDGRSTDEAVHAASLEVLRERRARGRSDRPFYWAPFVASGAWR
jgi:CHAT domain-containing protein/tetratricopeptide (TPR) repeat protein